ncbi:OLC1v1000245C1 [Oldenlandia corymbosa var. corymbosa]|uniref:OLC1v1000245C1 n=1 Tax=Oldenlandia corymbosa var. corymbosa TaxID=529605 RepID=A0AAV1D2S6_OLDCO|nr:OLC1v1000245C1 [Oldenlandia corymbosa var. corymbosa]
MRQLLDARNPPRITGVHREYEHAPNKKPVVPFKPTDVMVHRTLFFAHSDISAVRATLPPILRHNCSKFDVLSASLWRCWTVALNHNPDEEVSFMFSVNCRSRFDPPLPEGYYGNAIAMPMAVTTVGELINNPLSYAVELVMKAKKEVTEEYMKSLADLMVLRGRPRFATSLNYMLSDLTRIGLDEVDFGWGKPVYGGPATSTREVLFTVMAAYLVSKENKQGEKGIVVPVCFPETGMKRYMEELEMMMKTTKQTNNV